MKGQVKTPHYSGEERVRSDRTSLLDRLFKTPPKAPRVIDIDAINATRKAIANEGKTEFNIIIGQITGRELHAGESVSLGKKQEGEEHSKKEVPAVSSEHIEYFSDLLRKAENREINPDQTNIAHQIEEIQIQLKQIKESSDVLEGEFKDVVIDAVPEKPGVYHLTFFEGFLKLILRVKDKIDDATIFAKLFKSRKQERSYHAMAKKGGTSYTLHHDRAVATQTG